MYISVTRYPERRASHFTKVTKNNEEIIEDSREADIKRRSLEISQLIRGQVITTSLRSEGFSVKMDEARFVHVPGHVQVESCD